eukprot:comp22355_c0_seq2/m.53958 comp22355_c0_seq2/g.53958  ORF comp22355_c0_seq2/g.53958 comp22355_c0_seq2/m.53958 type:complete len:457 (-) comp22355_c0_seq2:79-1449(-)
MAKCEFPLGLQRLGMKLPSEISHSNKNSAFSAIVEQRNRLFGEASFTELVGCILLDIIGALRLKLDISIESIAFSARFDLAVLCLNGIPKLVIEVKRDSDECNPFASKSVAGQLYDYHEVLWRYWHIKTFSILSTLKRWRLSWVAEEPSLPELGASSSTEVDDTSFSPPLFDAGEDGPHKQPLSVTRSINVTETFVVNDDDNNNHELLSTLASALLFADSLQVQQEPTCCLLQTGTHRLVLMRKTAKESGVQWGNLRVDSRNVGWNGFPKSDANLYVVCPLGRGAEGVAFLVCTVDARAVAVMKRRHSRLETTPTNIEQNLKEESQTERLEKLRNDATVREHEWWRKVYRDEYSSRVAVYEDVTVLLMTYFRPIAVEDRKKKLDEIRDCLHERFEKQNLVHTDVRWRNIGVDEGNKVVLFDLSSVENADAKHQGWIDIAIQHLSQSAEPDKIACKA